MKITLSRRQKLIILALVLYWPALFVVAHIPVPYLVRRAGVSDKSLHYIAYMILSFLLWSAVSPNRKVRWRTVRAWLVVLAVFCYGIVDEVLQGYMQRSCDVIDLLADMAGTFSALLLLSLFPFWPVFLVVIGITIFVVTNVAQADLDALLPFAYGTFQVFSYALFTLVWIQNIRRYLHLTAPRPIWLILALILPILLLVSVKVGAVVLGRTFEMRPMMLSFAAILTVVGALLLASLFGRRFVRASEAGDEPKSL